MPDYFALWKLWARDRDDVDTLDPYNFGSRGYAEDIIEGLRSSEKYLDAMLELWTAASIGPSNQFYTEPILREQSHRTPDFLVRDCNGMPCAVFECKNHSTWSSSQIHNSIREANAQIRSYRQRKSDVPGVVVIGLLDNEDTHGAGHLPESRSLITKACNDVFRRLNSGNYRSVSRVYLVWDDVCFADNLSDYVTQISTNRVISVFSNPNADLCFGHDSPYLNSTSANFSVSGPSNTGVDKWGLIKEGQEPSESAVRQSLQAIRSLKNLSGFRLSPSSEIIFGSNLRVQTKGRFLDLAVLKRVDSAMSALWGRTIAVDRLSLTNPLPQNAEDCLRLILSHIGTDVVAHDRKVSVASRLLTLEDQSGPISVLTVSAPDTKEELKAETVLSATIWGMCEQKGDHWHNKVMLNTELGFGVRKEAYRQGICFNLGHGIELSETE